MAGAGGRSLGLARPMLAGIALGGIALAARYAPNDAVARARHEVQRRRVLQKAAYVPPPVPGWPTPPERAPRPQLPPDPFATEASRAACPADMTLVEGDFCPDVELRCLRRGAGHGCAEYARGVPCKGKPDPRRFCVDRYEWPNRIGENPLVYVDWNEAKALCGDVDKRLCRRSEWTLACEGPKRMPYPWGYVRQPSPCNVDRATFDFDANAMVHVATREGELARLWQADKIGAHPDCVSAFGAHDMAGNVDEWTDDGADDPNTQNAAALHGGYWGAVRDTCRLATTSHGPTFKFYQVGFRCCADTLDGVETPAPRPWIDPYKPKHQVVH